MTKQRLISYLAAVVITILAIATIYHGRKNRPIYKNSFHAGMAVIVNEDVTINTPCVTEHVTLTIYEDRVILTVGNDTLSGVPVNVTEQGELIVQISPDKQLSIAKIVPMGYEDTKENHLIVVKVEGFVIILTTYTDCEEITALLEQI